MQNPDFELHPSKIYCAFLGITLLMSAVIVLLLPLNFWLRVLIFLILAGYGVIIFWQYALLRAADSVIGLKKIDGKRWQLTTRAGVFESTLRGDSTVTAYVSVLRFDLPERRKPISCILVRDSLSADDYRRLVGVVRS
jgi:hypothetical protein